MKPRSEHDTLMSKPFGKGKSGIVMEKWEDNIKINFMETVYSNKDLAVMAQC
ncbi:hypothetical protein B7P43_G04365 [Cryptotermes secundus]|uniref:Uncharacterized protein n=1 Tax=Cryptotermes secundus TaxID=105785 RepID=A0A2J7PUX1_9NEOP|nr:hypothetical protein B7P43_G04365 [Cryptotermes secundus]